METYFAPAHRSDEGQLRRQVESVTRNPVVDGIIRMVGGLTAVLNENRQILTVNQNLLDALGVEDAETLFGLRLGEAVGCRHAHDMVAGCGTSEYCMTCGAAIAIVTSLSSHIPEERDCAITSERNGRTVELSFRVRSAPIKIEWQEFVLLFLNDISGQQRMAALERTFFHDINNTVMGLVNAGELLRCSDNGSAGELAKTVANLAMRLSREVELQRRLSERLNAFPNVQGELLSVEWIIKEVEQLMNVHPAMDGKVLQIQNSAIGLLLHTDPALVLKVLGSMLVNALEAAASCRTIQLNIAAHAGQAIFSVWNAGVIAPSIAIRVFQRNFSTKGELGRGLGTYAMKLIAEQLLGGRVYFESSTRQGTCFYLVLPVKPHHT